MSTESVKVPTQVVVKRLFARSGNRCAFPKCSVEIVQGDTVVGNICHIKAASPNGPRYDPRQNATERHGYDNLLLLCANHHTIIDDDPEAYTVDRLVRMKTDHEQRVGSLSNDDVNRGAQLLINNSVNAISQSGGLTAYNVHANTINIHTHGQAPIREQETSGSPGLAFPGAEPRDGVARFRAAGEPIGRRWDQSVFGQEFEVLLRPGPAMFLRLMPALDPMRRWSAQELRECGIQGGICLQPLFWTATDTAAVRAEDGFGMYSAGRIDREARSVAFAFETGEVWSVDTSLLSAATGFLLPVEIEKAYIDSVQAYTRMLQRLGIAPPYQWASGLTEVKDRRLQMPSSNGINFFPGPSCFSDTILAQGTFGPGQTPAEALRPFFELIFRKCGMRRPNNNA